MNRSDDEREIRELERAYDEAWSVGDFDGIMSVFTPDAVVVTPYGQVASGVGAIESMLRSYLGGDFLGTAHTSVVKAVRFVAADVAIVDAEATIAPSTESSGATAPLVVHAFTDVLVKSEGMWRISQVRAYLFDTMVDRKGEGTVDLGEYCPCLNVADLRRSIEFYQKLDFRMIQDHQSENWAVLQHNNMTLCLFQGHIDNNLINFRGGDIEEIHRAATARGLQFSRPPYREADGSWSSEILDPDSNVIYLNTMPEEREQYLRTGRLIAPG